MDESSQILQTFLNRFPVGRPKPQRTIGREAEFPVVHQNGKMADISTLWPLLNDGAIQFRTCFDYGSTEFLVGLEGKDFSYSSEVGKGTIEIISRPCNNLFELQNIMNQAIDHLLKRVTDAGLRLLGFGIQPKSDMDPSNMVSKQRYQLLHRILGERWLLFTMTASDQVHVNLCRDEVLNMINYGNLIAPVLVSLCGNSSVIGGKESAISSREKLMSEQFRDESFGMIPTPFFDLTEFIKRLMSKRCLILRDSRSYFEVDRPFQDIVNQAPDPFEAFLVHDHYLWNHARARAHHGTLEIRPCCQQPQQSSMSVAALSLGLIEAEEAAHRFIRESLGANYWSIMYAYLKEVALYGLNAPEPKTNFLSNLIDMAEIGLKQRKMGEEIFLEPCKQRLRRLENPGQNAVKAFGKGWDHLLDTIAFKPTSH